MSEKMGTQLGLEEIGTFFTHQLLALSVICFLVTIFRRFGPQTSSRNGDPDDDLSTASSSKSNNKNESRLSMSYLIVYALVMAADWLQGPYAFRLYHHEYGYSERTVAFLFVLGFAAAGLSANYVGLWADRFGRKFVCLVFCATYASSAILILSSWFPILIVSRLLGGFSTSILFSVFETWLVSSANILNLPSSALSSIFGTASLVNGLVAALAGVSSNSLVDQTKTSKSPFVLSSIVLVFAGIVIQFLWNENHGDPEASRAKSSSRPLMFIIKDSNLLSLALIQTLFESSMYLFVFQWVPTLEEAVPPKTDLPLGNIFSFFMVSMMLGSHVYSFISSSDTDTPLTLHARMGSAMCLIAALSLIFASHATDMQLRFWGFSMFEACVGAYFPVMGFLKGKLISDESRGNFTALLRLPLNITVALCLMTGVEDQRELVFKGITIMLLFASGLAFVISKRVLNSEKYQPSHTPL